MSFIKKPSELKSTTNITGLIYGQPGVGKSTLAISTKDVIFFDLEERIMNVEAPFRCDYICLKNYPELIKCLEQEDLSAYKTIVIDTVGMLNQLISESILKQKGRTTLTQQDWGILKNYFVNIIKAVRSKNKNIIFVAHEKEEPDGDKRIKRPDMGAGKSGNELIKMLDFIGYMYMQGEDKRVISFTPTENYYAKNSIQLEKAIEVPNPSIKGVNDFIDINIIKKIQNRLEKEAKERDNYMALMDIVEIGVDSLKSPEDFTGYIETVNNYTHIWDSLIVAKRKLLEKANNLGFSFNKDLGVFE